MNFEDLPKEFNDISREYGINIYKELRKEFPEDTPKDLDLILNSLCMALICVIRLHSHKDNWNTMIQLVSKIITKNC